MLFLFTLLAIVIGTGVIDKTRERNRQEKARNEKQRLREERQAQEEYEKQIRQAYREERRILREQEAQRKKEAREERERRRNILKLPPPKKMSKIQIIRRFEQLDEQEMKICRNNVKKAAANPHWRIGREFAEFKKLINETLDKRIKSTDMSATDKRLIKVAERLFIPESGWTRYQPLRSSWLIVAKYNKPKKELVVQMRRGKAAYRFHKVPGWAYVALITKMGHVGKMWWDKWYWRWSTNRKWKGQRKKWQSKHLSKS